MLPETTQNIYVASNNTAYLGLHVKCPIFLSHFNQIRGCSRNFHERRHFQMFTEICPLEAVLIRRDRWTDDDIDVPPDYANALKMTHVHRIVTDKAFARADNAKSVSRYCLAFMVVTNNLLCFN
jgi:hypothetical protein